MRRREPARLESGVPVSLTHFTPAEWAAEGDEAPSHWQGDAAEWHHIRRFQRYIAARREYRAAHGIKFGEQGL
jgi:hypothetical protein